MNTLIKGLVAAAAVGGAVAATAAPAEAQPYWRHHGWHRGYYWPYWRHHYGYGPYYGHGPYWRHHHWRRWHRW